MTFSVWDVFFFHNFLHNHFSHSIHDKKEDRVNEGYTPSNVPRISKEKNHHLLYLITQDREHKKGRHTQTQCEQQQGNRLGGRVSENAHTETPIRRRRRNPKADEIIWGPRGREGAGSEHPGGVPVPAAEPRGGEQRGDGGVPECAAGGVCVAPATEPVPAVHV